MESFQPVIIWFAPLETLVESPSTLPIREQIKHIKQDVEGQWRGRRRDEEIVGGGAGGADGPLRGRLAVCTGMNDAVAIKISEDNFVEYPEMRHSVLKYVHTHTHTQ